MIAAISAPIDRVQRGGGKVQVNADGTVTVTAATTTLTGNQVVSGNIDVQANADNHVTLRRGSAGAAFTQYIDTARTWVFEKGVGGAVGSSLNIRYYFNNVGGLDAISPFWSGFNWGGHSITEGGGGRFPALALFAHSSVTADPTDYEFLFSMAIAASSLPGSLGFGAKNITNSFVRFGFGNAGLTVEGFRALYDGTDGLLGVGQTAPSALLHVGTKGTKGHLRMDGIAGNPASPTAGDHWYNSTQKAHRFQATHGTTGLAGLLKSQSAVAAGDTINTTAAETNFATNIAIPANGLTVGKVIHVKAWGVYGTAAAGTLTLILKLKMGTTALLTFDTTTTLSNIAARVWYMDADLTVVSVGAAGTIEAKGEARIPTANTNVGASFPTAGGAAPVTIDTTAAQTLQLSAQHGASAAANTITMRELVVEVLD